MIFGIARGAGMYLRPTQSHEGWWSTSFGARDQSPSTPVQPHNSRPRAVDAQLSSHHSSGTCALGVRKGRPFVFVAQSALLPPESNSARRTAVTMATAMAQGRLDPSSGVPQDMVWPLCTGSASAAPWLTLACRCLMSTWSAVSDTRQWPISTLAT